MTRRRRTTGGERPAATGRRRRAVQALLVLSLLVVTACSTKQEPVPSGILRGGTLGVLLDTRVRSWDPQRMPAGPESQLAVRTFLRTLTTQAPAGVSLRPGLVGDLATNTGYQTDGGRSWTFTLVSDALWQDGRRVTCADVRYGVSRSFAREQITGGAPYPTTLLDIPVVKDGAGNDVSAYAGPYVGTGQELFDKAVTCSGQDITFHLKAPMHDFDQVVSLPAFAPYRKDQDKGGANTFSVFSCGPYMLEGTWEPGSGGRFVRNRSWLPKDDPVRAAFPDVVDVREGLPTTTVVQRLIDDQGPDRGAVTYATAPPAIHPELTGTPGLRSRVTNPDSPMVEYLLPNFRSPVMSSPAVRRAFAMSTNREAFVAAYGGPTAMVPTYTVLARDLPGRKSFNPFGVPLSGDPAAAKAVLVQAGVTLPVPVRVAYRGSRSADTAFAALKASWGEAGFAVSLTRITGSYDRTVSAPDAAMRYDVFHARSSAHWPSGSSVIPQVFDGRVNITPSGPGQDLGYFDDAAVDRAIDEANAVVDNSTRNSRWGTIDEMIARAGGHIALGQHKYVLVHGSAVAGYEDNLRLGGGPDLATIRVRR